jgi:hypothetical protein
LHWFFTNDSTNDGNTKQLEMMAKWSPNLDAPPKHVSHLVHMPHVELQNSLAKFCIFPPFVWKG